MSRIQKLRVFVSQRLNAAVDEILAVFEKTIVKYEEEAALSQEVISRQHALLCALHKPLMGVPPVADKEVQPAHTWSGGEEKVTPEVREFRLAAVRESCGNSAEAFTQQLLRNPEAPPEHQEQEDSEPPQEQEGELLQDLDEADIIQFTYNPRRAARSGEDVEQPETGSADPEQEVQLVSSETEDSDDYSKDSTDTRSAAKQPKEKRRHRAGGAFSCRVCIRTFKARRFLFRHVKAHLQEAEPVCGLCGKQFEAAESLKIHIQTHRTSQRRKRELETQTRTRSRDRGFHQHSQPDTNARTHTCDDCGQSFLQVWKKKRHRCLKNQEGLDGTAHRTRT